MHYRPLKLSFLLLCLGLLPSGSHARDVLMAKGNAQFTVSMSPVNLYHFSMKNGMDGMRIYLDGLDRFEYNLNFSKPLSFTAEYALSSYTTVGLNVNYFSYSLSELREDDFGTTDVRTKGTHMDLHLRAVRYLYATPGSALYLLAEAGTRMRSVKYTSISGGEEASAYINSFPETRKADYSPVSYDYGIGMKVRLIGGLGLSAEFTMLSLTGRYGLFYVHQPAGRRSKDNIGW